MKQPQGVFVALQQQANEISRNSEGPLTTRDIPARKHAGLQHRWEFDGINTTFQRFRCCSGSQIKIDHQMSFNKITAAEDANSDTAARTNANTQMCVVANRDRLNVISESLLHVQEAALKNSWRQNQHQPAARQKKSC